jgi:hypothetical protein
VLASASISLSSDGLCPSLVLCNTLMLRFASTTTHSFTHVSLALVPSVRQQVGGESWWDKVRPHASYALTCAPSAYRFELASALVRWVADVVNKIHVMLAQD